MRIPRLYVPALDAAEVQLEADSSRRLRKVLRLGGGDRVTLFDGAGLEADAVLLDGARAAAVESTRRVSEPGPLVHLHPALIRANRFDWVIEKAVELGATSITPVISERSLIGERGDRAERWRRIAIEAAEQSNRKLMPSVRAPVLLETALEAAPGKLIVAWEREKLAPLGHAIEGAAELSLFTGPEGGYSDAEIKAARAAGAELVTLGPFTLRAETAAIVALGAIRLALA
jgi:16S rRNA (uracil1498-N3)-methyltransferase